METGPELVRAPLVDYTGVERRRKPRIYEPFRVKVRGTDASGESFDIETALDNLSAGGLYLRLPKNVEPGAELFIVIRFSHAPNQRSPVARVATHGKVVRTEPQPAGFAGLAVAFTHYRIL